MSAREKLLLTQLEPIADPGGSAVEVRQSVSIWAVALGVIVYCALAWALVLEAARVLIDLLSGAYFAK